ncbi:hypothetical protein CPAR01_09579 [Colletotrichum paranaense]|uniref:Protein kinase domain-containing protein n=1 Tax=Colletotrichum paranaense TaxID=1914294 RepID=A0ABQ9SHG4_9PEZI|nr:uncharacterized protein CPAR01_09579 [Colletotrichum paranaense]KAK1536037.1 hypothetical protein CPAR01_09579 [Colletotrichum paranaense]
MSQFDFGREFLNDFNPERSLEFYPEGRRPPNVVREQSDVSITTKSNNYNYGIDLVEENNTALLWSQPDALFPGFVGGAFEPHGEPSNTEADLQLENEIGMGAAEAMCEQIHEAMQSTGPTHSRPWLPSGDLHAISHRNRVSAVLRQHFSEPTLGRLTDYVCGTETGTHKGGDTSQRIFVILVLIRRIETLPALMKDGLRDRDLPFEWLNPVSRDQLISPKSQFANKALSCFERRGKGLLREFYENQWKILAPIIDRDKNGEVTTFHLAEEVIMPWTFIGDERKEGSFSMVRKVEIHQDHHSFHNHKAFALKTLLQTDPDQAEDEFEQELKAFTKMEPGDHILDLCATFKIGDKYSFLFPWAEGGNLKHFWNKCPTQVQKGARQPDILLRWVAEQCHALAAALQSIHEVRVKALKRANRIHENEDTDRDIYGIHGDIKPENILLFNHLDKPLGIGTLKIADFGLTEFHRLTSRTRSFNHGSDARQPAPTYEAPELVQLGEVYSRKADVWALGCVFSEFLTWVVRGHLAVGEFGQARAMERDWDDSKKRFRWAEDKFFVATYNDGGVPGAVRTSLKLAVDNWLDELYQESKTEEPNFLTDFLDLLGHKVLVCERDNRVSCERLVMELEKFASRAGESRSDDPYWRPPLPSFRQGFPKRGEASNGITGRRVAFAHQSSASSDSWICVDNTSVQSGTTE